jgi:imidazolonepropionase-like amidohydrolase
MNRVVLACLLISAAVVASGQQQGTPAALVITHVTIVNPTDTPPMEDMTIVVTGTRITAVDRAVRVQVPSRASIVDGSGKFVIPGLADMHHHLASGGLTFTAQEMRSNFRQSLAWGITSVFAMHIDMPLFQELKKAASDDAAAAPHFYAVGRGFATLGGYRPNTPEEARSAVRELKSANVDAVKIAYDDMNWATKQGIPVLTYDVMATVIDEAHRQGLKAYVHAPILPYAKEAARAGADGFVHGILSDPIDDEFLDLLKKNRAVYMSTLSLFEACADIGGWTRRLEEFDKHGTMKSVWEFWRTPGAVRQFQTIYNNTSYVKEHMTVLHQNLKQVFSAGVPIVAGTDSGFPGVVSGPSSLMEPVLHVQAGLSPKDALQAASINAAKMLNREKDMGTVEAGKLADFILLDADPLRDISNVRKIHRVVKGGVVYDPAAVR